MERVPQQPSIKITGPLTEVRSIVKMYFFYIFFRRRSNIIQLKIFFEDQNVEQISTRTYYQVNATC